jgi:hypothetical protein
MFLSSDGPALSHDDGSRPSFRNVLFFRIPGQWSKCKNSVVLCIISRRWSQVKSPKRWLLPQRTRGVAQENFIALSHRESFMCCMTEGLAFTSAFGTLLVISFEGGTDWLSNCSFACSCSWVAIGHCGLFRLGTNPEAVYTRRKSLRSRQCVAEHIDPRKVRGKSLMHPARFVPIVHSSKIASATPPPSSCDRYLNWWLISLKLLLFAITRLFSQERKLCPFEPSKIADLYAPCFWFEYRPGHGWPDWLTDDFRGSPYNCQIDVALRHGRFLPYNFQFIIYTGPSMLHIVPDIVSLSKPQINK